MSIKLCDTRSGEPFEIDTSIFPLNIYVCGPTVYTESHVGHLKTYMSFDLIRRVLRDYFSLHLNYMMNITNVDDKIIRRTYETAYPDIVKDYYDLAELSQSDYLQRKEFEDYANHWESRFFEVMANLNIEKPDILSRVTDYIPEILEFVDAIDQNGYAFEHDGSVYFYGTKYGKIEEELNQESGEYSRNPESKYNFVLLKKVKPYEPGWASKWGTVRPGWHIECSAMASSVFGKSIDIHGGGIDLAFPHHCNEVLQSDARFYPNGESTWVSHFMHTGHLNIAGLKMSRSLKNFITIEEILENATPDEVRMLFATHHWASSLDYTESMMVEAKNYVESFKNFDKQLTSISLRKNTNVYKKYTMYEIALAKTIADTKMEIDSSLRNNIDTNGAIASARNLISEIYKYVESVESDLNDNTICTQLLGIARSTVVELIDMLGFTIFKGELKSNKEESLLKIISDIRIDMRKIAKDVTKISKTLEKDSQEKQEVLTVAKEIYSLTDDIRNKKLAEIGVFLTDS